MSLGITTTLLDKQVELMKVVLGQMRGMEQYLVSQVQPHLDAPGKEIVDHLRRALDVEDEIDPHLPIFIDVAIVEIREAIAAGTTEERIAIPPEQLIGCAVAFDRRKVLSPAAEALRAALPRLVSLQVATQEAFDHAEAIRLSIRLIDLA